MLASILVVILELKNSSRSHFIICAKEVGISKKQCKRYIIIINSGCINSYYSPGDNQSVNEFNNFSNISTIVGDI